MTTFPIGSRVRVSDQHSQYRNRLGTVVVVGGTHTDVQLDRQGGGRRYASTIGSCRRQHSRGRRPKEIRMPRGSMQQFLTTEADPAQTTELPVLAGNCRRLSRTRESGSHT